MNSFVFYLIIYCVIIPTLSVAFGVTATILDRKHKIGEQTDVEFSKHHTRIIEQFETSEKAMEKTVKDLKKINGG